MISKDVKLTIRISEDELNEIDEYLNTNQEFGNRSEFIRHAALEYIGGKRVSLINTPQNIDLDENSKIIIKTVIEKGFFKDANDVISAVLRETLESNILKIIKKRSRNFNDIMKKLDEFGKKVDVDHENEIGRGGKY